MWVIFKDTILSRSRNGTNKILKLHITKVVQQGVLGKLTTEVLYGEQTNYRIKLKKLT